MLYKDTGKEIREEKMRKHRMNSVTETPGRMKNLHSSTPNMAVTTYAIEIPCKRLKENLFTEEDASTTTVWAFDGVYRFQQ